jgi:hypothetical protein
VCGAPRVVRTGRARLVVLIPAPRSCPCGERRGLRGEGTREGSRRRGEEAWHPDSQREREERVGRKEQRAHSIPRRA